MQDALDEAQIQNRDFRRSLSDSQEAGLKPQTKKLTKSDVAVAKSAKAIEQLLDEARST